MKCAYPSRGREFAAARANQVYCTAKCRKKDSNRRWPVKRQSAPWKPLGNAHREAQEGKTSYVTLHEGIPMPQRAYARGKRSRIPVRSGAELQSAEYLTTREVADLLHVSLWGLFRWRHDGNGPPLVRLGRNTIRYPKQELDSWLRSCAQGKAS